MIKPYFALLIILIANNSLGGEKSSIIIDYKININYKHSNQELEITLKNNSPTTLKIREDAAPYSLLVRGINFSAFEETNSLKRVPLYYPIGSNPNFITIPPHGSLTRNLEIKYFMKDHCKITKEKSVLVFWSYSARAGDDGEDVMLPSDGVFRIDKHDKNCD